jgi:hypothetical protein
MSESTEPERNPDGSRSSWPDVAMIAIAAALIAFVVWVIFG